MGYYESRGLVRTRGIRAFEVNDILVTGSGGCAGARGSVCDLLRWQKGDLRALRRKALSGIRQISGRRCADHRQYDRRRRPERWICAGGRNPLRKELFTLDEIGGIRRQYGIGKVIITHLEEDWGKSYDDYRALEEELDSIFFAYDGLRIRL